MITPIRKMMQMPIMMAKSQVGIPTADDKI
jgi:hypothetical protein